MTETERRIEIQAECCKDGNVRLWRNNVGEAWAGAHAALSKGAIVIANPYRITYGLCVGSSDLIGGKSIVITPEMVGQRFLQFVAIEVKDKRRLTKGKRVQYQLDFIEMVKSLGGIAGMVTTPDEAKALIK